VPCDLGGGVRAGHESNGVDEVRVWGEFAGELATDGGAGETATEAFAYVGQPHAAAHEC
jgi:hypothetical protein